MIYRNSVKSIVLTLLLTLGGACVFAQPETDVYLATLEHKKDGFEVSTPENISRNPGYDNQPYFLNEDALLYSRTRNGQTDIAKYSLSKAEITWISDTPGGSEYSPVKIPGQEAVSSIRLDTTGLQRLYSYPLDGGANTLLIADLKIGYHLWYTPEVLVCTVLIDNRMDLVVVNLKDGSRYTYQKNVGRSLERIPDSDRISYTALEEGKLMVKSMNPISGATETIAELPKGVQDICWLDPVQIICGVGAELHVFKAKEKGPWKPFYSLQNSKSSISRIAYDIPSNNLALVVEVLE